MPAHIETHTLTPNIHPHIHHTYKTKITMLAFVHPVQRMCKLPCGSGTGPAGLCTTVDIGAGHPDSRVSLSFVKWLQEGISISPSM